MSDVKGTGKKDVFDFMKHIQRPPIVIRLTPRMIEAIQSGKVVTFKANGQEVRLEKV